MLHLGSSSSSNLVSILLVLTNRRKQVEGCFSDPSGFPSWAWLQRRGPSHMATPAGSLSLASHDILRLTFPDQAVRWGSRSQEVGGSFLGSRESCQRPTVLCNARIQGSPAFAYTGGGLGGDRRRLWPPPYGGTLPYRPGFPHLSCGAPRISW
jgi:hypothetical protein